MTTNFHQRTPRFNPTYFAVLGLLMVSPLLSARAEEGPNSIFAIDETIETRSSLPKYTEAQHLSAVAQDSEYPAEIAPSRVTPYSLVSQLDLECRPAQGKPPVEELRIRHLNPVIKDQLPDQSIRLGELKDVCVPVAKNGKLPEPKVRRIAQWIDLACYRAESEEVELELDISHLNPELAELPREHVVLAKLAELCVPVLKNDSKIPKRVREIVEHVDVACYDLREPTKEVGTSLLLSHLNPVIREMGLEDHKVTMRQAHQLCVPVGKNDQQIPSRVERLVSWIDFLRYEVKPDLVQDLSLVLTHINPLFADSERFEVKLGEGMSLMVPVAKNGKTPPHQ